MQDQFAFFVALYVFITNALGTNDALKEAKEVAEQSVRDVSEKLNEIAIHHVGKRMPIFFGVISLLMIGFSAIMSADRIWSWSGGDYAPTVGLFITTLIVTGVSVALLAVLGFIIRKRTANRFQMEDGEPKEHVLHLDADNNEVQAPVPGGQTLKEKARHPDFNTERPYIAPGIVVAIISLMAVGLLVFFYGVRLQSRGLYILGVVAKLTALITVGGVAGLFSWAVRKGASAIETLLQITVEPIATLLPDTTSDNVRARIGRINIIDEERIGSFFVKAMTYISLAMLLMDGLAYLFGASLWAVQMSYAVGAGVIIFWAICFMMPSLRARVQETTQNGMFFLYRHSLWVGVVTIILPSLFFIVGAPEMLHALRNEGLTIAKGWGFWGAFPFFFLSLCLAIGIAFSVFKHEKRKTLRVLWTFLGAIPLIYFFIALKTYRWEPHESAGWTIFKPLQHLSSEEVGRTAKEITEFRMCLWTPNCATRWSSTTQPLRTTNAPQQKAKTVTHNGAPKPQRQQTAQHHTRSTTPSGKSGYRDEVDDALAEVDSL